MTFARPKPPRARWLAGDKFLASAPGLRGLLFRASSDVPARPARSAPPEDWAGPIIMGHVLGRRSLRSLRRSRCQGRVALQDVDNSPAGISPLETDQRILLERQADVLDTIGTMQGA
jgi:hypothetical protein